MAEKTGQQFEQRAREFLSRRWGVRLPKGKVLSVKEFDFASGDGSYIGDAKWWAMPAGKQPEADLEILFHEAGAYVWLLQKTKATHKFLVFGKDLEVPKRFVGKYARLLDDVAIYFLDGGNLEVLHGEEPMSLEERRRLAREAFGMWADHEEITSAVEYVERLRAEWGTRMEDDDSG